MKKLVTMKSLLAGAVCLLTGALHAQSTDTEEFKPSGNLWGYVFGDYAMKTHNDTLGRGAGNVQYRGTNSLNTNNVASASNNVPANSQSNAFQIRRMYLGYDYNFARNFSAYAVLANEQTVLPNNQNTVYLKYAYGKWSNIFKGSDLLFGQLPTASFATANGTEPLWGYRSVERTIMDMHNNDGSTDLGLSLQGSIWKSKTASDSVKPTMIGYILQVGNGNSAVASANPYKKVRINLFVSTLNQKLVIGLYGDNMTTQYSPYYTYNQTMKVYASFRTDFFHIGVEAYQQINHNSDIYQVYNGAAAPTGPYTKNDTASGVQMGVSVFASAKIITNKLNVFARYDMYNPDTKWNSSNLYSKAYSGITGSNLQAATFYKQNFITAGLDWTPTSRIHIMPNIWYNSYSSMPTTTKAAGDPTGKTYSSRVMNDNDMVYRLTFYFVFNGNKKISNNGYY
jgi:hypothetical protein